MSVGRGVASVTLAANATTLARLAPALGDVLASARVASHTLDTRADLADDVVEVAGVVFVPAQENAAAERPSGLRDTIPVGSQLTMRAASAATQVLLTWEDPERMHRGLQNAAYSATALAGIRRRGWAQSVGEREQGVASVSAPVRSPSGKIIAAVSVSGPLERLSRQPGRMHAPAVLAAAERLSESLRRAAAE